MGFYTKMEMKVGFSIRGLAMLAKTKVLGGLGHFLLWFYCIVPYDILVEVELNNATSIPWKEISYFSRNHLTFSDDEDH